MPPVRLVFETATLADSIKKAFACTPKKGAAFDKAAGLVFEFNPTDPDSFVIRATNTEVFYTEWVDSLKCEGPDDMVIWRFNSQLIAGVVGGLPIGSGKTLTFTDNDGDGKVVHLTSGRTKCKFNLMSADHYPQWAAFDPDSLVPAPDFGGRMAQVEWAVDKADSGPLGGVRFDGEYAYATNKYRLAMVPFKLEIDQPVTLPSGVLSQILKKTGEVMVGSTEHQFLIMPDEHTQIRTVIYAGKYPRVSGIVDQHKPDSIKLKKAELIEMITRAMNFAGNDRFPTLRMFIGKEEIAVMMANEEMGMLGDVYEVDGQAKHDRFELKVSPDTLKEALGSAPNDQIVFEYDATNCEAILRIDGGSGYRAWVMPRTPDKKAEEKSA